MGEFRRGIKDLENSTTEVDAFARPWPEVAGSGSFVRGDHATVIWLATVGRFEEAIQRYEQHGLTHEARFGGMLGYAKALAGLGRVADAGEVFRVLSEDDRAARNLIGRGSNIGNELTWLVMPYFTDDVRRRRALMDDYFDWVRQSANVMHIPEAQLPMLMGLTPALPVEGEWNPESIRQSFYLQRAGGSWGNDHWRAVLATIALHQGDVAVARQAVSEILPDGPDTEPGDAFFLGALAAQRTMIAVEMRAGHADEALKWLHSYDRWMEWSGAALGMAEGQLGWARYHRVSGDLDRARAYAERAYDHASEPRQPLALIAADRFLGQIDVDENKHGDAEKRLTASLELAEQCQTPFEQALTLVVMAERAAKLGEVDDARHLMAQVREIGEPLGAKPTLKRVDEIEAILPRARRNTEEQAFGLTGREVERSSSSHRGRSASTCATSTTSSGSTTVLRLRSRRSRPGLFDCSLML